MVLADVGLFDLIWTTIFIAGLVLFVGLVIFVVRDLFRDHELSGWAKVGWLVAVVIFPFLGSIAYLIVRAGGTRGDRLFEDSVAWANRTRTEVERQAAATPSRRGRGGAGDGAGAGGRLIRAGRAAEQRSLCGARGQSRPPGRTVRTRRCGQPELAAPRSDPHAPANHPDMVMQRRRAGSTLDSSVRRSRPVGAENDVVGVPLPDTDPTTNPREVLMWWGLGIIGLIIWIAIAFWPARVAGRKGHSFIGYFLLSLLFFPLR